MTIKKLHYLPIFALGALIILALVFGPSLGNLLLGAHPASAENVIAGPTPKVDHSSLKGAKDLGNGTSLLADGRVISNETLEVIYDPNAPAPVVTDSVALADTTPNPENVVSDPAPGPTVQPEEEVQLTTTNDGGNPTNTLVLGCHGQEDGKDCVVKDFDPQQTGVNRDRPLPLYVEQPEEIWTAGEFAVTAKDKATWVIVFALPGCTTSYTPATAEINTVTWHENATSQQELLARGIWVRQLLDAPGSPYSFGRKEVADTPVYLCNSTGGFFQLKDPNVIFTLMGKQ